MGGAYNGRRRVLPLLIGMKGRSNCQSALLHTHTQNAGLLCCWLTRVKVTAKDQVIDPLSRGRQWTPACSACFLFPLPAALGPWGLGANAYLEE